MRNHLALCLSPRRSVFGPLFFSGDLASGLRSARALGYARVELSLLDSSQIEFGPLSEQLAAASLSVSAIATGQTYYTDGYSLFAADRDARERCVARLKGHCDLASRLGAALIIGGIRGRLDPDEGLGSLRGRAGREALRECADYAAGRGVTLLLEPLNRYESNLVNTLGQAVELIEEMGVGGMRVLADTFHMNIEEADMPAALIAAGPRLGYVHCADSNRLAPGWGHTDFPGIFDALARMGYGGPIGVEALPRPDDLAAARQAVTYLGRLLADR